MPRSPSDATRFTATGPYASSSPNVSSNGQQSIPSSSSSSSQPPSPASQGSRLSFGAPAPENETPQQKIARLRAAAARSKQVQEPGVDRMIRVGRAVADRAHRVTAIGLIGLTVVTGMVATAGITDMLLHNRRRRNEWLAEKQAQTARDLAVAKAQLARGDKVSEELMLVVNRERAAVEAEEERRSRPGVWKRMTGWAFGGLEREERRGGKMGVGGGQGVAREEAPGAKEEGGVVQAVEQRVEGNRRTGEKVEEVLRPLGGPLDRQAESAVRSIEQTSKSWTSWIMGR